MTLNHHGFSLSFDIPVAFTAGVFETENDTLANCLARLEPNRRHRLLVVIDDGVIPGHPTLEADIARYVNANADRLELACPPMIVEGGEASKQGMGPALEVVARINEAGIDRQSFVVVIGGGAVLDMASFAAAVAHRGVRVVRLPSTTLSQGDSGIAVKNGVNLFGKKNFAGTFVPPFAVINDSRLLASLSARDRRCGVAEAVKVAVLRDPAFFEWLEAHASRIDQGDADLLEHAVRRSAELHLAHICGSGDPFELGSARPMDFGHWAAHKLESLTHHAIRHGEAVAIGMALDLCYSVRAGFLTPGVAERILRVLDALGFTLFHDALLNRAVSGELPLLDGVREFREHLGGDLHITLLRDIGRGFEANDLNVDLVAMALDDLSARAARTVPATAAAKASA
jgi:3-dehydroquinate synthase